MKTRAGIFETNSSSTHSCVIGQKCDLYDTIGLDKYGTMHVEMGEYSYDEEPRNALGRAGYMAVISEGSAVLREQLTSVLKEQTGASDVVYFGQGYIDDYSSTENRDMLFRTDETVKEFIFNPQSHVEIGYD